MNLLKSLLPICFLPLTTIFCFQTNTFEKTDTIKVYSTGINNNVIINSIQLKDSLNELILSPMKGEITQTGQSNSVNINTGDKIPNNKDSIISNKKSSTINIKQTGKNNSVKIKSR